MGLNTVESRIKINKKQMDEVFGAFEVQHDQVKKGDYYCVPPYPADPQTGEDPSLPEQRS